MKSKLKVPRKLSLKKIKVTKRNHKIKEFVINEETGKKVRLRFPPSRNSATLASFALYCQENPNERFWQALRSWSDSAFILADQVDTFWREGRLR